MPRKPVLLVLSTDEVARLEQWAGAGATPQRVALRARVVLLAAQGQEDRQIAVTERVHRHSVALWRKRVRDQGIGCLWEVAPGRGRKAVHGQKKIAQIITTTLHEKPPGSTHWSTRTLAAQAAVSTSTVHRLGLEQTLKPPLRNCF